MKLSKIAAITLSACMVLASTSLYARGGNGHGGNGNGGGKSGEMSGNKGSGNGMSGNMGQGNKGSGNRMSNGQMNYKNSPTSFSTYDTNKDGKISQDEFDKVKTDRMTQRANEGKLLKNASKSPQFSDIDTDKDGIVSESELSTFQQNRRQK